MRSLLIVTVAATQLVSCRGEPVPPKSVEVQLHLSVGGRRGFSYRLGEALTKALSSGSAKYSVDFQSSQDVETVQAIQRGSSDCGFTSANIAYEAFAGLLPDDSRRYDRLRGVALVQLSPLHFVVRQGSQVHQMADLRGRSVVIGSRGGGTSRIALLVLRAFGLDRASVTILDEGFGKFYLSLPDGISEGAFLLYGQSEGPAHSNEGVQVVPIDGPAVDRLRQEYPFIRPALIPAGTYAGQDRAVRTIGVESMIVCRVDLNVERVQDITDAWFRATNQLLPGSFMFDAVSPDLASATPIPLHEGATRYYRSRRLTQ